MVQTRPSLCKSCVLPETGGAGLGQDGSCRLCSSPSTLAHIRKQADPEALERILAEVRRRGAGDRYDCMVAWSGGRDSTFMLRELVQAHKLRCVAVFGRTPFTPQEITDNVRRIAADLGIELVELASKASHLKVARFCLQEWSRKRQPILINLACAPCKFINRDIFKTAARLGVKTVIYGGNRFEYFPHGPASVDLDAEDRYSFLSMVRDNLVRIGKGVRTLVRSPFLVRHLLTFLRAALLYVNQYTIYLRLRHPDIVRFDYFHYADWDEAAVNKTLDDLGWQLPPGCTTSWRADCVYEAIKNAAFLRQLGFTYNQALYSNLIRAGKLSREAAMARMKSEGISEPRLREVLRLCDLPEDLFGEKS